MKPGNPNEERRYGHCPRCDAYWGMCDVDDMVTDEGILFECRGCLITFREPRTP